MSLTLYAFVILATVQLNVIYTVVYIICFTPIYLSCCNWTVHLPWNDHWQMIFLRRWCFRVSILWADYTNSSLFHRHRMFNFMLSFCFLLFFPLGCGLVTCSCTWTICTTLCFVCENYCSLQYGKFSHSKCHVLPHFSEPSKTDTVWNFISIDIFFKSIMYKGWASWSWSTDQSWTDSQ